MKKIKDEEDKFLCANSVHEDIGKREEGRGRAEAFEFVKDVKTHIKNCEGKHIQQVAYSSYHDALTQVCFGCKKVRSELKTQEKE